MFQKIKDLIKYHHLRKSEKKWILYGGVVETQINWLFAFIDQFEAGGHFNSHIILMDVKQVCNSVVVINLNKRLTEEVLIHNLNHEALHLGICECVANQKSDFVETVIDDWIMGESVVCKGWEGNLYIKKVDGG